VICVCVLLATSYSRGLSQNDGEIAEKACYAQA
jgi:hypothetical protein